MTSHFSFFVVIVVGNAAVGKTNLIQRWKKGSYDQNNMPTVGTEWTTKQYQCEDSIVKIQMWDTAGQERYRSIVRQYYRGAHGALVVYDVTNRDSFDSIVEWLDNLRDFNPDVVNMQILLVGNKSDRADEREVQTKEGVALATRLGLNFLETSALSGDNCSKAFQIIFQDIYKIYKTRRLDTTICTFPLSSFTCRSLAATPTPSLSKGRRVISLDDPAPASNKDNSCPC